MARTPSARVLAPLWLLLVTVGAGLLVAGLVPVGPDELTGEGSAALYARLP